MLSEERAPRSAARSQSKHPYVRQFPAPGMTARHCDIHHKHPQPSPSTMLHATQRRYYCVYILGSLSGTLYIGFSGNLHRRIFQHKFHQFEGFTDRYEVVRLLFWESYDDVHKALAREKQFKGWTCAKKIALIVRRNPQWLDLAKEWYPWMESREGRDASTPR